MFCHTRLFYLRHAGSSWWSRSFAKNSTPFARGLPVPIWMDHLQKKLLSNGAVLFATSRPHPDDLKKANCHVGKAPFFTTGQPILFTWIWIVWTCCPLCNSIKMVLFICKKKCFGLDSRAPCLLTNTRLYVYPILQPWVAHLKQYPPKMVLNRHLSSDQTV